MNKKLLNRRMMLFLTGICNTAGNVYTYVQIIYFEKEIFYLIFLRGIQDSGENHKRHPGRLRQV